MKSIIPFMFLVAEAYALPADNLEPRQVANLLNSLMGASKTATVLKTLIPEYDSKATRAMYMYGPFKLAASNATHAKTGISGSGLKLDPNSDTPGGAIEPPCKDCTVYKAMANFAYKDGKQADVANGVYVHHIILADLSGKMQLMPPVNPPRCKNGAMISPIPPMDGMGPKPAGGTAKPAGTPGGAGGMQHGGMTKRQIGMSVFIGGGGSVGSGNPFSAPPAAGSPVKSGYWIGKGGRMQLTSEIVNYDPVDKDLYLTLDIEWAPGKEADMYDVGMGALSADACLEKEKGILHPPKDKAIVYKGEEWDVIDNGYMMNFTPHIHDGGVNIKVFLNNNQICEAKAIYGSSGGSAASLDGSKWETITGYTPCDTPAAIKKGDKIHMTSEYDLTKHRLRPDSMDAEAEAEGMALANFIFARPFRK
ncbi:hypothetical protein EG328_008157 [Venturia inaequalis]|uniref:Uncharacterized protein n=2 Tax=Venturia inaequalis TaxID=5025 RepID=A0A8H3UDJ2_VENIN|nr:hypothetical protein EG328_008157 [Venturia inaequalis]